MVHAAPPARGLRADPDDGAARRRRDRRDLSGRFRKKQACRQAHADRSGARRCGKQVVLGMRQRGGRTVAMPIRTKDKDRMHGIIEKFVRPGTMVYTDDHPIYNDLMWHRHESVCHSAKEWVNGMAHTNGIESVWAVLKRGFNGTYHQWSRKHCRAYVDEFTFRLNEGNVERDTQDRLDDLFRAMVGKRITYRELTQN
ncbi:MAG: IS1595 family transposase [Gammaproteobacteria bacterium]|nr:IS1595 family transposase [Gammaproteobacteria bacterium]